MKKIIMKSEMAKELMNDYIQAHKAFRNIWRACDRGNRYTENVPKWLVVRVHKNYEAARDALFCVLEEHTGREVSHINENGSVFFIDGKNPMYFDKQHPAQLVW